MYKISTLNIYNVWLYYPVRRISANLYINRWSMDKVLSLINSALRYLLCQMLRYLNKIMYS